MLFSEVFGKHEAELALDRVAFFKGQVDRSREKPQVVVSQVIPIEQADEKLARSALVRLDPGNMGPETLTGLQEVLARFPGETPIYLEVRAGDQSRVVVRPNRRGICLSRECREAFDALLGPDHLAIIGANNVPSQTSLPDAPAPEEPDDDQPPIEEPLEEVLA